MELITETDASEKCTAILPVGADGLTIEDVPDGKLTPGIIKEGEIVVSLDAEAETGARIVRVEHWNDVTVADNLLRKAADRLAGDGVKLKSTISVTAADLGGFDAIPNFSVGRYVRLQSTPHGYSAAFPLMVLDLDLLDPAATQITMGQTIKRSFELVDGVRLDLQEKNESQKTDIDELTQNTMKEIASVVQTCQGIIMQALQDYVETSNFETYKKTVSSQLAVMADEISIKITQTSQQIKDVDGDLQEKYSSITKYIRATIDGLLIGETGNEILLRLDNDQHCKCGMGVHIIHLNGEDFFVAIFIAILDPKR